MTRTTQIIAAVAMAIALSPAPASAQTAFHGGGASNGGSVPHLHTTNRWKECSFQLDASLTQAAWRQFTQEAGLVVYFRSLTDARPMGKGNFELSILQWKTGIDDHDAAWNDTFVHPDAEHWLFEGSGLAFPGLTMRAGVGERTDVGLYVTKNPNANYGFYGLQLQQGLLNDGRWSAAARASFVSMYGPEDVDFSVYGVDLLASRKLTLARWVDVSPYASVSTFVGRSHEKSAVVTLSDETTLGAQGAIGAALDLSKARLAIEYNVAKVNSFSMKIGVGF